MSPAPKVSPFIKYYFFWTFLHFAFLFIGWNGHNHQHFWPFSNGLHNELKEAYDFSEFLVYVVSPLIAFLILIYYRELAKSKEMEKLEQERFAELENILKKHDLKGDQLLP